MMLIRMGLVALASAAVFVSLFGGIAISNAETAVEQTAAAASVIALLLFATVCSLPGLFAWLEHLDQKLDSLDAHLELANTSQRNREQQSDEQLDKLIQAVEQQSRILAAIYKQQAGE